MTFTLPFRRADVFKEVTQFSNPLGADNVEVRFERDGKPAEEGAAVKVRCHERLRAVPNGWHPVAGSRTPGIAPSRTDAYRLVLRHPQVGVRRTAIFQASQFAGRTISECIDLVPDAFIKWRQVRV